MRVVNTHHCKLIRNINISRRRRTSENYTYKKPLTIIWLRKAVSVRTYTWMNSVSKSTSTRKQMRKTTNKRNRKRDHKRKHNRNYKYKYTCKITSLRRTTRTSSRVRTGTIANASTSTRKTYNRNHKYKYMCKFKCNSQVQCRVQVQARAPLLISRQVHRLLRAHNNTCMHATRV